jgi:hypothetical protein
MKHPSNPRILNSRKRVIIALIHTVAFCGLATYTATLVVHPLAASSPTSAWIIATVYLLVSAVLLALTAIGRTGTERLYFGLCTVSAALGFCRQILGDSRLPAAGPVRVALLACAVLVGLAMLRASTVRR